MKVLVLGATGYVGTRFVPEAVAAGHEVLAGCRTPDALEKFWWHELVTPVEEDDLSAHLRSRLEVERILRGSAARTLVLRAAMVVGAASVSYEVLAQMTRTLPVVVVPTWMETTVEPVAVTDVVGALLHALDTPELTGSLDLGGGERLLYRELIDRFAGLAGIDRAQLSVPLLPKKLVASIGSRLIDVPTPTVAALMESLEHDMVADPDQSRRALPGERVGLDEAPPPRPHPARGRAGCRAGSAGAVARRPGLGRSAGRGVGADRG